LGIGAGNLEERTAEIPLTTDPEYDDRSLHAGCRRQKAPEGAGTGVEEVTLNVEDSDVV
jgi:hypothetical protein